MIRTKKQRKPFSPKKYLCTNKEEIYKGFENSNILCFYCQNPGHFIWDYCVRKRKEGRAHASTTVEEGEPSQEKSSKEEDDGKEKFIQ